MYIKKITSQIGCKESVFLSERQKVSLTEAKIVAIFGKTLITYFLNSLKC